MSDAGSVPELDAGGESEKPVDAGVCDALGDGLAAVSCDFRTIVVAQPIELHPNRADPEPESRRVLDSVAEILRRRQDILLLRIEVYSRVRFGKDAEKNRAELAEAQRRADALYRWLWRRRGIWAERLDAVGYPRTEALAGSEQRWPVVLRIVQRKKSR